MSYNSKLSLKSRAAKRQVTFGDNRLIFIRFLCFLPTTWLTNTASSVILAAFLTLFFCGVFQGIECLVELNVTSTGLFSMCAIFISCFVVLS